MIRKHLKLSDNQVCVIGTKKRHLKIPNQFNEFLYGDIGVILTKETDNYTELIYRFKIEDLKKAKQKKLELKKVFEIESQKKQKLCESCGKPLNTRVVMFVNIEQNPVHYFCKKECKFNWIYKKQQGN